MNTMRLSGCGLQGALVMVVCMVMLLFLSSPFFIFRGRGKLAPRYADSLAHDPMARSEALKQHIRKACTALNISQVKIKDVTLSHLLYDDTHKVLYCYIPKVACTSWRRVFLKMTGHVLPDRDITTLTRAEVHSPALRRLINSENPEEKLKTYKKFMFVRHPVARVLSAFRDKLEGKDELYDFHEVVGKQIEKKYRGTTEAGGHNVTFQEFIRYISEPGRGTPEQRNEHWLPMYELCDPCSLEYDFIGTKTNLEEDAYHVLKWLGVAELIGKFPASDKPVNANRHVAKYLKQLNHKEILAFNTKFRPDFLLFDYEFL